MGDVISGHISKGVIHQKVDAVVNHRASNKGPFDKRAAFYNAVKQANTPLAYFALLEAQAEVTRPQTTYLKDTFYSSPNVWWPGIPDVYSIFHVGFVKALEEAGDNLPLDSYWLPAGGAQAVEVIVCKSATQVTRIFLTPPVPAGSGPMNKRHTDAPIWVINAQSATNQQKGFEMQDAVVISVQGKVVTWQRREFP
jgi:hypothetical protein